MNDSSAPAPPIDSTASTDATHPALDIRLLGGLVVHIDGAPMPKLRSRQGYRLLALLALRHGKSVERAFIATALWPDTTTESALSLLRRSLTDLRAALGEAGGRLESPSRHTLRLNMQAPARLDVIGFEQAASALSVRSNLDSAIALYRGPLLEDYDDEWISLDRLRLEGLYEEVLQARNPLTNTASARGSNTPIATIEPRSSSESDKTRKGNLPVYTNRFIGRKKESRLLSRMLCDVQKRLVTITGIGGTGKTRFSVQVADSLRETFTGGIFFVPLNDTLSPLLIPQSVASAIGLTAVGSGPLIERIARFLSNSADDSVPRLLLIDNCEHLLRGTDGVEDATSITAFVSEILDRTSANLTILTTSRQALGLPGEHAFPLKPLPSAKIPGKPSSILEQSEAAEVEEADSVLLFVERAQEARPDFSISSRNAAVITEICDSLDGLPLAIEIAASWTPMLSPQQIGERLKRMDSGGQSDVLVNRRHISSPSNRRHSLNAMLEWSFQLLSLTHQTVFALLSVFRGGWDIDAAEAVYSATENSEVGSLSTLYILSNLKECSLVVVEAEDALTTRYRFLETIRMFARGKLELRPEVAAIAAKSHAAYFAELIAKAAPNLRKGDQQVAWINRLNSDVNNLRAALDWYQNQVDENEALLKFCSDINGYWESNGALAEGYGRMAVVLSKTASDTPSVLRARVLNNAGSFAWQRGEYGTARIHYEEAIKICRAMNESGLLASSTTGLANVTYYEGDHDTAFTLYEQGLELARQEGDSPRIALALGNLGVFAQRLGEYSRAIALFEEQLAIRRTIGDPVRIAITLSNLATSFDSSGLKTEAEVAFIEAESIFRTLGYRTHLPYVLRMRGVMARNANDLNSAEARFREAITLEYEGDLKNEVLESLSEYALLKSLTGEYKLAVCLMGAVAAAQERFGFTSSINEDRYARTLAPCTKALGSEAVQSNLYQGHLLTLEATVAAALA